MATILPNCLELMAAYWAAAKTGIVIVPCSTLLQESGLSNLLQDSDTVIVIADGAFADTMDRIRGDLSQVRDFVLVRGEPREGFLNYDEFMGRASDENPQDPGLTFQTPITSCIQAVPPAPPKESSIPITSEPCTALSSPLPGG